MSDLKPTIALTSVNSENMSRHQMIEWVNNRVNGKYTKIEELCSGAAYCQMLELVYPNCLNLKRVKLNAKLEHEYFHNLKMFQSALTKLKLDKIIPMDRLIKGRFQDNFEFLQWFMKFYESQAGHVELPKPEPPKPIRKREVLSEKTSNDFKHEIDDMNAKIAQIIEARDQAYHKLRIIENLINEEMNKSEPVEVCKELIKVLY
ncbi:CG18190, partial [Drosophila busckii]